MHIMIDDQKPIEVEPLVMRGEEGESILMLTFDDTHRVLSAWMDLRPGWRSYRWSRDESDTEPSTIIIAEALQSGLVMDDVDPFWDGGDTHNGYDLDDLAAALPLAWGDDIGEGVKP